MTCVAYRDGVLACDSQVTVDSEAGGARKFKCDKIYRKTAHNEDGSEYEVLIGTAGDTYTSMLFVDWYGSGQPSPEELTKGDTERDFECLIVEADGIYTADMYCRPVKVKEKFYAVGSGAKAALGAMHMGADAVESVKVAIKVCPYCAGPVVSDEL